MDLESQVGAKIGRKNKAREAKKGEDKGREGKRREGKGKEEEGKGLEGKGVEKCGRGFSAGGGGVYPSPYPYPGHLKGLHDHTSRLHFGEIQPLQWHSNSI